MVEHLLSAGSLTFGGTMAGDRAGVDSKGKICEEEEYASYDMTASRGRK